MELSWAQLPDITALIRRSQQGDRNAAEQLFTATYPHLAAVAKRLLGKKSLERTFTPEDLLHVVYIERLRSWKGAVNDRYHYLALVTKAMKEELIDRARRAKTKKRTPPEGMLLQGEASALSVEEIRALDWELERIAKEEPRVAQVVRLKFYFGCTWQEIAAMLGTSVKIVRNDWEFARQWLQKRLGPS